MQINLQSKNVELTEEIRDYASSVFFYYNKNVL
ncbi:MAG: hypothetical protein UY01_C0015G0002 [Candidatus Nomurabacteria bacterium GW2011_GWB1_47_6]|uniref:Uncharacterized protein n=1 Tax=Candidatus Nomurabacteria bacterium GW2011_GWB1_47_6 TaxID=1618749 RepID=A0A0G1VZ41_9BACT|nr:MAG: hypothetical protein UY01_C0015G0002 [Candidatus Nomurabacteria bacterium GW2011_GWB1_47_6]